MSVRITLKSNTKRENRVTINRNRTTMCQKKAESFLYLCRSYYR